MSNTLDLSAFKAMLSVSPKTKNVIEANGGDSFVSQMLSENEKVRDKGGLDGYYRPQ